MKISGKKLEGRNVELVPIIRPGGTIMFRIEAVENYDEFNKLVPIPTPPQKLLPGGVKEYDTKSDEFKIRLQEYSELRTAYIVIASISATENLEWEKVNINDPRTWTSYINELKDFGLTELEIQRIVNGVTRANSLDENMIEQAKKDFLAGKARPEK